MKRERKFYIIVVSIFVAVAVCVLAVEVWGFLKISDNQSSLAEQKYRLTKLAEKSAILASLSKNYTKFEKDSTIIYTALPDQKDSSKLLSDLDTLAKTSGLKMTGIQSSNFNKKAGATSDQSLLQTIRGKYAYELPLEVKVSGSYQNYVNFIKRIENYQRLINISSMEITKSTEDGAAPDQINVKLNLTAYLKK